jgi:hypothetical protein
MHLEAYPVEFVALSDGVLDGREHVILFVQHAGQRQPRGFALTLSDARALLTALRNILPEAQQIQDRLRESN